MSIVAAITWFRVSCGIICVVSLVLAYLAHKVSANKGKSHRPPGSFFCDFFTPEPTMNTKNFHRLYGRKTMKIWRELFDAEDAEIEGIQRSMHSLHSGQTTISDEELEEYRNIADAVIEGDVQLKKYELYGIASHIWKGFTQSDEEMYADAERIRQLCRIYDGQRPEKTDTDVKCPRCGRPLGGAPLALADDREVCHRCGWYSVQEKSSDTITQEPTGPTGTNIGEISGTGVASWISAILLPIALVATQYDRIVESTDGYNPGSTKLSMEAFEWQIKTQFVLSDVEPGYTKDEVIAIIKEHGWPDSHIEIEQTDIVLYMPARTAKRRLAARLHFSNGKLASGQCGNRTGLFHRISFRASYSDFGIEEAMEEYAPEQPTDSL